VNLGAVGRGDSATVSAWRPGLAANAATIGIAMAIVAASASNGGYFPTAWGWLELAMAWCLLVVAVLPGALLVTRSASAFVAALGLLAAWSLGSSLWSLSPASSMLDSERSLIYVSAAAAMTFSLPYIGFRRLASAVAVATSLICAYALLTRLFPERATASFDAAFRYRLYTPIGYWNGLGIFAAIGLILALGLTLHASRLAARLAASSAAIVLVLTLYFTFSRGAWLSLAVGIAAFVVLDPGRVRALAYLFLIGLPSTFALVTAERSTSLTTLGSSLGQASREGHRLAVVVIFLSACTASLTAVAVLVERHCRVANGVRVAFVACLAACAVGGIGAGIAHYGQPWSIASRGWSAFTADAPRSANLNQRLFHLSGTGRIAMWRSAAGEFTQHPLVGSGAGTFETWWFQHREHPDQVRDAHSLYLEMAGELGIVGLLLLGAVVCIPLAEGVRNRRQDLVPYAVAGVSAWAVHAAVDWDWEIPVVTVCALACAAGCFSAPPDRSRRVDRPGRTVVALIAGVLAIGGVAIAIGNHALAASQDALDAGNYASAQTHAQKAARWAPWLSQPWIIEGQIAALDQDRDAAKADFKKAVAKDPRNYLAWYGLAGVTSGAAHRRAVARTIELNPLSDEAKELRSGS
jgi:hypothetical protein